jgi:peptidoglycan/xylan/chitin deacetylase (PgdA/CDA1 family)
VRALAASRLFELGNHTWDHRAWTLRCYGLPAGLSAADKRAEVQRTAHILVRLTGRAPVWFRLPGLCHDDGDLRIAARAGEQTVDGVPSGDAFQPSAAVIVRTVIGEVRPGSIIVMHMMGPPNAPATGAAVKALIPELRARVRHTFRAERVSGTIGAEYPRSRMRVSSPWRPAILRRPVRAAARRRQRSGAARQAGRARWCCHPGL